MRLTKEREARLRADAANWTGSAGNDRRDLFEEIDALVDELEQERVKHAVCGVSARGYHGDVKLGDYGWSDSVQAVIDLYAMKEALRAQVERLAAENGVGHALAESAALERDRAKAEAQRAVAERDALQAKLDSYAKTIAELRDDAEKSRREFFRREGVYADEMGALKRLRDALQAKLAAVTSALGQVEWRFNHCSGTDKQSVGILTEFHDAVRATIAATASASEPKPAPKVTSPEVHPGPLAPVLERVAALEAAVWATGRLALRLTWSPPPPTAEAADEVRAALSKLGGGK